MVRAKDTEEYAAFYLDKCFLSIRKEGESIGQNIHQNTLSLQDYLPDVKIGTALNSLRNAFFMAIFFDDENKVVETELLKDVLSNPFVVDISEHIILDSTEVLSQDSKSIKLSWQHTEDLNDIAPANLQEHVNYASELNSQYQKSYAYISGTNSVYVYDYPESSSQVREWSFYRHNFKDFGNDDDDIKPSIGLSPMPVQEVDGKVFPFSTKKGISEVIPETDDVGFQLLHWYGVLDVPYATPLINRQGNEVLGTLDIDFNSNNGIVTSLGLEWLSFLANCEEFRVLLTNIDIWKLLEIQMLFLPKKKKDHPRWVLADNVRALPRQASAEIDITGKVTAFEMKLVKSSQ